jgi:MATE family multidrug resistance protein
MNALPAQRIDPSGRAHVDVRALLRFAAPLMVTNAIQAVLNLTDAWFVGRLSTDALAAMSAIYWVMICLVLVLGGVSLAVQTFVAQAIGSRRAARASQAAWCGLWASLATVPVFFLLAEAGPWILAPFNLSANVEQLALEYWRPRMWGAVLGLLGWTLAGFFTGVGAVRVTLLIAAVTMLANVPANQFCMFTLDLGMAGAAWGTNIAQGLGFLVGFTILLAPRYATRYLSRLTWRPDLALVTRLLKVGLPIGIMYGADVLGAALFQLMIVQTGSAAAAASQVVIVLTSLSYLPALGLAGAATTFVGQSIGAGERDWANRVGTRTILFCSGYMLCVGLLLLLVGPWLLPRFITAADAAALDVVAVGVMLLAPAAAYQAFDGLYFGSASALRGAGDTRVPAATALVLSWFFFVPLAHFLIFTREQAWIDGLPQAGLGAFGGWLALMCYAMLLGLSMFARWRSGRWRRLALV